MTTDRYTDANSPILPIPVSGFLRPNTTDDNDCFSIANELLSFAMNPIVPDEQGQTAALAAIGYAILAVGVRLDKIREVVAQVACGGITSYDDVVPGITRGYSYTP